jgi:hypothetical protein
MDTIQKYAKAIAALIGALALAGLQAFAALLAGHDGTLTGLMRTFVILTVALAVLNALATYFARKTGSVWSSAKFWINVAHVVVQAVLALLGTGQTGLNEVTLAQWIGVAIVFLTAAGVTIVPNEDLIGTAYSNDGQTVIASKIAAATPASIPMPTVPTNAVDILAAGPAVLPTGESAAKHASS